MKTLCLHSLRPGDPTDASESSLVLVSSNDCTESPIGLWMTGQGELQVSSRKPGRKSCLLAGWLFREDVNSNAQWLLTPWSAEFMHNGIRPMPLAIVEPGDLLAWGNRSWLTSELWRPAPAEAPRHVGDKECSVCGGPLKLAPVIQCPCGRFYHLESPDNPEDPQALNCYLTAGMCGLCERKPSLEPQFLPIPPDELIPWETLEQAIAAV